MEASVISYLLMGAVLCLGLSMVLLVKMLLSVENGYFPVTPKYIRIIVAGILTMIISGIIHTAIIDTLLAAEVATAIIILGGALATMVAIFQATRGQGLNNPPN